MQHVNGNHNGNHNNGLHLQNGHSAENGHGGNGHGEFDLSKPRITTVPERWTGIRRDYSAQDVEKLSGSVRVQHTLAELGADRLWTLLHTRDYVHALGALTGNQAVQMVKAGLEAIYLSGWQV